MRPTSFKLHIAQMFRKDPDINHMKPVGLDLSSYDDVKARANDILDRLKDPDSPMPPVADGGPWPEEWISLFERWIGEGTKP